MIERFSWWANNSPKAWFIAAPLFICAFVLNFISCFLAAGDLVQLNINLFIGLWFGSVFLAALGFIFIPIGWHNTPRHER